MQQLTRSHLATCLFSVVLISGAPATVRAAADQATIQEILDGDQLFIDSRKARVQETASLTQQVITTRPLGVQPVKGMAELNVFTPEPADQHWSTPLA